MGTEGLPQKSFERNMNHNYMILGRCDFFDKSQDETDYRVRMLLDNKINGLLPVSHRMINGESKYYYEINSLQSMDRVYAKDELDHQQLCNLLKGCIRLYDALEEYLLDGSQIILKPEFIYLNMDSLEPYFVYYPYYENDARDSFAAFIEDLLRKVDHTDEQAVMLAYQVYRYTRNQNYVLNEIMQMLQNVPENHQEVNEVKQDIICKEENYDDWDSISSYQSAYTTDNEENAEETKMQVGAESKDFKGAVICLVLAAGAVGLLCGSQFLGLYPLTEKQVLYLYGAVSMSIMAGVIFLACYFRKKNREKEIEELQREDEPIRSIPTEYAPVREEMEPERNLPKQPEYNYGDTICLQQLSPQEPYLSGRVNGEDITIRLDKLPITLGKMAGRADYVICDNTVSKIHARIEERNGAIYVEDLNSTNGTLRNGTMIGMNEPVLLKAGDELTIGRVNLRFCV